MYYTNFIIEMIYINKTLIFQRIENKPLKPYIIGLTGGIASGKSSVAEKLKKLGAALVNCDKIAHDLYLPGNKCFDEIVNNFDSTILKSDGFIDRKILGHIVFNDKVGFYFFFILLVIFIIFEIIFKNINLFIESIKQIK